LVPVAKAGIAYPVATPSIIAGGVPTQLKISALISDPAHNVVPNSVTVLQLDQTGRTIATLGILNDSGNGADLTANDGIFSGTVMVSVTVGVDLRIRISAAFQGVLQRAFSEIATVEVVPPGTPTQNAPSNLSNSNIVPDPATGKPILCNQVIAYFRHGLSIANIQQSIAKVNGTLIGVLPSMTANAWQVEIPCTGSLGVGNAIALLETDPTTEGATSNHVTQLSQAGVNDPYFSQQWAIRKIGADQAWNLYNFGIGPPTANPHPKLIGIVDTGIDYGHEDLNGKVILGYNWVSHSSDPRDDNNHGTHVAGIASAFSNNNIGIAGIISSQSLIAEKVCNANGSCASTDISSGIRDAVDKGAQVINLSLAGYDRDEIEAAALDYANRAGRIVLAAAGNDNCGNRSYPSAFGDGEVFTHLLGLVVHVYNAHVLAVGATDQNDTLSIWTPNQSQCTPESGSNFGSWVNVYAPGTSIISTIRNNSYATWDGTSMATPHVTGATSFVWSVNPNLTADQVVGIILSTTDNTGTTDPDGNTVRRLNILKAVQKAASLLPIVKQPPTAGFLMTSDSQSLHNGQGTLKLMAPAGGSMSVTFNGSAPTYSSDSDGTVISWLWSINGAQASTGPIFTRSFGKGTYQISLFVGDDKGAYGPAATASITVNELPTTPLLLAPASGATMSQNIPSTGCVFDVSRGYGLRIDFDWSDATSPTGMGGYELYAIRSGNAIPILDVFPTASAYSFISCNSFVADTNLDNWQWRVRARDSLGNFGDWTAFRTFSFAPCRLANGAACSASTPAVAANGWRMSGYNGQRTNSTIAAGPVTSPNFLSLLSSANGTLSRIMRDGSLLVYDGTTLRSYAPTGAAKWSAAVGGVSDIAISPSGTIYTSTPQTLSAWNGSTGQRVWPTAVTVNSGNETSALAVDSRGSVYIVTGASYVGPSAKVSAFSEAGTLKWENALTFRGYEQFVLSSDESLGYILGLVDSWTGPEPFEHAVSTATGSDVYGIASYQQIRGNTYAFAPWDILYTGGFDTVLVGCAANFSACSNIGIPSAFSGIVTLTSTGLIIVPGNGGKYISVTQAGAPVWTSSEALTNGFSDSTGTLFAIAPGTSDIVAFNPATGQQLWRQHFSSAPSSLLLGDDGCLYASVGSALYKGCR
jgi:thermitase